MYRLVILLHLAVRGYRHLGNKKGDEIDREDAEVLSVVFSVSSKARSDLE